MDVTFTAERINDGGSTSLSTAAEKLNTLSTMPMLIFTDHQHNRRSSVASRTTHHQLQRSSEIPMHMQTMKTDAGTSPLDNRNLTTDYLQPGSTVGISLRESRISSAEDFVNSIRVISGSVSENEDASLLRNLRNLTTAVPLRDDDTVHSKQPLEVSQVHVSEDAQKTLVLSVTAAARDTGHVSTSYKATTNVHLSQAAQVSVSATVQKSLVAAGMVQTEAAHSQTSSSALQSSAVQITTSQSSESPGVGFTDEHTSTANHSSFLENGTSGVMRTPVNNGNAVAFSTAISVGIVLGILTTFILTVSLVVILRRRRKTDNLQTLYACAQKEKSILSSKMCSTGRDYTEVAQSLSRHNSIHKADEVFLLPHEQVVDSSVKHSDTFDELDQLVHIDTDMSSLLHIVDSQLGRHSRRSGASDDTSGYSWVVTEPMTQNSENQYRHPDFQYRYVGPVSQSFHEYDTVYVPHNDAAAMARRVDNETSYVRTLQSLHNFSPYEEVHYGVRSLLLPDNAPAQVPDVPPRTSSITDSHLQNSCRNRMLAERDDRTGGNDTRGELLHRTGTVSDVDVADDPYESIVINPV